MRYNLSQIMLLRAVPVDDRRYLSFTGIEAKANYKNTILAEVLPVDMLDVDDRVELPQGCKAVNTAVEHVITQPFSEWPPLLGYNKLIAKEKKSYPC
ncbi:pathogenicity island protein [Salmonella enterica subsp. diarizonae]|uniref:Pathogenicity island protein n=1 Tax=Salmonella diarizonae TaxID=59204 RepID=A0A379TY01_SALDZ|nr:pathogenicity island protein [Salmonella enterica subsp. diarizonae]